MNPYFEITIPGRHASVAVLANFSGGISVLVSTCFIFLLTGLVSTCDLICDGFLVFRYM